LTCATKQATIRTPVGANRMAAVQETDEFKASPGTHGAVVGPRMAGGMSPTSSPRLSNPPRGALRSSYCHRRSTVWRTKGMRMVSPEFKSGYGLPRIVRNRTRPTRKRLTYLLPCSKRMPYYVEGRIVQTGESRDVVPCDRR